MALDAYVFIGYPINEHEKVIMKKLLIAALLTQPLIVGVNAADHPLNDISGDEELAMRLAIEEFEEKKGRSPEGGVKGVNCPHCGTAGQFTEPRAFSGLLKTFLLIGIYY